MIVVGVIAAASVVCLGVFAARYIFACLVFALWRLGGII
jgi:hypothetical protein